MPLGVRQRHHDLQTEPNGSNYHIVSRVARDLLLDRELAAKYLEGPIDTQTDLVEATKRFCARKHIDYGRHDQVPFDVVHRACASEWLKFTNPGIAAGTDARPRQLASGTSPRRKP